jgi:hypothetical protein
MGMCDACSAIDTNKRGKPGHNRLEQTGSDTGKPFAQAKIIYTYYACADCGTKWRYEDDKNDSHAGWSTVV